MTRISDFRVDKMHNRGIIRFSLIDEFDLSGAMDMNLLREKLPPLFRDLPLENLLTLLVERSQCLSNIAMALGLEPTASVQLVLDAFNDTMEPANRSTAELDLELPHEYIAMTAQIHRLEIENRELKAESVRMQRTTALKSACSSLVRKRSSK